MPKVHGRIDMRGAPDFLTDDLFQTVPKAADLDSPAMDLKVRIANAMSRAMKACPDDRYQVAAHMSRILGRQVSKHMLDAYAAASKDAHIPNLAFCIAFDSATGTKELLNLHAALSGCTVLFGEESLRAELGRLELQEQEAKKLVDEARKKKRALKEFLGRKR